MEEKRRVGLQRNHDGVALKASGVPGEITGILKYVRLSEQSHRPKPPLEGRDST